MSKSMKERLAAGERIPVTSQELEDIEIIAPNVTLEYKLRELEESGTVSMRKSSFKSSRRWTYQDRDIHFVHRFTGKPSWKNFPDNVFNTPCDLAVDLETNSVLAWAKS